MNRWIVAALAGVVVFSIIKGDDVAIAAYNWQSDAEIRGTVTRVVDADTIELEGQRIRLVGIDAPERGTEIGDAAADFLSMVALGAQVWCHQSDTDRHGRAVAQCFIHEGDDAMDLGEVLINFDMARRCDRHDPTGLYVEAEEMRRDMDLNPGSIPQAGYCR